MINYQVTTGVKLSEPRGLPSIAITPEGRAMGGVPGWTMMSDPNYCDTTAATVRNRAIPATQGESNRVILGNFQNGEAAFNPQNSATSMLLVPHGDINPNEWTGFCVCHPIVNENGTTQRIMYTFGDPSSEIALHLAISSAGSNIIIFETNELNDTPVRLSALNRNLADRDTPSLIMWSFSVENGLSIFDNGELVARAADDKRPLQMGYGSGEWRMFANARGLFGIQGMLNIDLGAEKNRAYRQSIERYLMQRYGVI